MKKIIKKLIIRIGIFNDYFNIKSIKIPITFKQYIKYKFFNNNKLIYWPIHKNSIVTGRVKVGKNSSVGATPGCYIQGLGGIYIGNYTIVAPNVGIISANHEISDYRNHVFNNLDDYSVRIGDYCWIGMNSVVLPGVELGNHTIVAAGAVVTKSYKEGYCIIAGVPAVKIKSIDKDSVIDYRDDIEYYGYIRSDKFDEYLSNIK